jgi:hypothetical protein
MPYLPRRSFLAVAAFAAAVSGAGCARAPGIPDVTITATDFAFGLPDSIPGGLVRVHFVNNGQEPHHAQFVRLNDGVSAQQFDSVLDAVFQAVPTEGDAAFGRLFQVATLAGGPAIIGPGGQEEVVTDLAPGDYRVYCFFALPGEPPHIMKGMGKALVVTAPAGRQPAAPVADARVELKDFAFEIPALKAGRTVLEVTNAGPEPHEMNIVRVKGISAAQFLSMVAAPPDSAAPPAAGPPPFEFVGGSQGIMPGKTEWVTLDLTPGDYVALCFIPSPAHQGMPHVALGMSKAFTVS